MRQRIFNNLYERMAERDDIFLLTADMGINLVEPFGTAYPSRFRNVGIAEQNLIGIGAGLCNAGFRPFLYTISNFLIHRCFEQIRNDIVMHGHPAILLGTSTGYDNAPLGPTHHIIDDWGALSALPGIDIYCPSGAAYADAVVDKVLGENRPAYVRIPKGAPEIPGGHKDTVLVEGASPRVLIVTYGGLVSSCLEIQKQASDVSVLILNRLRPLDERTILDAVRGHENTISVEDHFPDSGLYSALCRLFVGRDVRRPLVGLGPRPEYNLHVGSSPVYYHRTYGFDTTGLLSAIERLRP